LMTFNPTPGQNPGRMNLFEVGDFRVLIDYAHNVPALEALWPVLRKLSRGGRIMSINCGVGNRLDEDLQDLGAQLAKMYAEIFLSDPDPRGRKLGETPAVIRQGAIDQGMPADHIHMVQEEAEAVEAALAAAQPGDLIVMQVDYVHETIERVRQEATKRGGSVQAPIEMATGPSHETPASIANTDETRPGEMGRQED